MFKSAIYIGLKPMGDGINLLLRNWRSYKTFNL